MPSKMRSYSVESEPGPTEPSRDVYKMGESQVCSVENAIPTSSTRSINVPLLILSLAFSQYFTFQSAFILSSFYPHYCQSRGLSGVVIGIIMGVTQGIAIFAVYGQVWMMNVVSPKRQLVGGLVITGLSSVAFGLTDSISNNTTFIVVALLLKTIQGLGIVAVDIAVFVIANIETPMKYLSRAMGVLEALLSVSIALAAPLGGLLYEEQGFYLPFLVSGGLCLLDSLLMAFYIENKEHKEGFTVCALLSHTFSVKMLTYLYHFTVFGALIGFFGGMIEPHLRKFGLTPAYIGTVILITNGIQAATYPVWGIISDKTKKYNAILFLGYAFIFSGLIFFGPLPGIPASWFQLPVVLVSLALCGTGLSAISISIFLLGKIELLKICPSENVAAAVISAAYIGFSDVGITLGDMLGGSFIDFLGYRNGSALWALIVILGVIIQALFCIINNKA